MLFCFPAHIPCSFQHITLHLVSCGAWRPCLSFLALKSHFRNCLPRPKITTRAWVSLPNEEKHLEQPNPPSFTSLTNPRRLWAAMALPADSSKPQVRLWGSSRGSMQPPSPCREWHCHSQCHSVWATGERASSDHVAAMGCTSLTDQKQQDRMWAALTTRASLSSAHSTGHYWCTVNWDSPQKWLGCILLFQWRAAIENLQIKRGFFNHYFFFFVKISFCKQESIFFLKILHFARGNMVLMIKM